MSELAKIVADFTTQLATKLTVGGTTVTIQTNVDDDGVTMPDGTFYFTIDGDNSLKEHIRCTKTGSALSAIYSVSRQGVPTSGAVREHRAGSKVVITDFFHILGHNRILTGEVDLDHNTLLKYDATADRSGNDNYLATMGDVKAYVLGGGFPASTTVMGYTKISVAPVSSASPISVGDNDPRVPTQTENDALAGTGTPGTLDPYVNTSLFLGVITPYAGYTAPAGWLLCDGAAISRTTYANLFNLLNPLVSTGTFTVTLASPGVFTLVSHGLVLDDTVYFTTTGALPTGLTINTRYFVVSVPTADTFTVSATKGGSAINTSVSQSGVHTARRSAYGVGDGTTTFNVPSLKGVVPVGRDSSSTEFNAVGETGGEKTHVLTVPEMPAHTHVSPNGASGVGGTGSNGIQMQDGVTGSTGSGTAHNNLQPYISLNYIIKT